MRQTGQMMLLPLKNIQNVFKPASRKGPRLTNSACKREIKAAGSSSAVVFQLKILVLRDAEKLPDCSTNKRKQLLFVHLGNAVMSLFTGLLLCDT